MRARRTFLRAGLGALAVVGGGAATAWELSRRRARAIEDAHPPIGRLLDVPVGGDGPHAAETITVHALDVGPRDAPTVVLIHGASGNLRDFAISLVEPLSARFRVVAFDRPGQGWSARGPASDPYGERIEAHRPDVQARIMRTAAERLDIGPAILLGHSLGAASALAWALDAPETTVGLVSLAGVSNPWPGGAGALYDVLNTPVLGALTANVGPLFWSETGLEAVLRRIFAPQEPPADYARRIGATLALRRRAFRHNGVDVGRLKPLLARQETRYPAMSTPIEAMHGDADRVVSATVHAETLSNQAPNARLTILPGIGHMPHHAATDAVVDAIERLARRA